MTRTLTRAFRDMGIAAACSALVVMSLPATSAHASQGAFDQPAAGAPWTLGSVDSVSASLDDTSKAYMSATNNFDDSPVQVDISVADSATGEVSLRYYSPQNDLVGWHGSVSGDFEIPPVDGSAKIVAVRVDEGEKDKPFGAQDNPRDYGYGCIAPAGVIINGIVPAGSAWQCDDMGTLTITFSKPVVDPVVSFGGFGGGLQASAGRPEPYSYLVAPRLRLTAPASATVSLLKGNGNLVASGTDIGVPHPGAWAACNSTYNAPTIGSTPGFPAKAGCGTVKITGTGKTFTFSLSKKVYMLEDDSFIGGAINKPTVRTATDQFSMQVGAYIPETKTITYNANGGTGTVPSSSAPAGWDDTIAVNGFTAPGTSVFLGWSTNPNATVADPAYDPGDTVAMPANGLTLYAVWDPPAPQPTPPPPPPPAVAVQAVSDYYTTPMNTPMTAGDAAAKDYAEGATLTGATWRQLDQPTHGTVTGWDNATGKFTYTPAKDWYGTDSFRYIVCLAAPNDSICSIATEYITVPPTIVAVNDYYSTALNTPMTGGDARAQDSSVVPGGITGSTVTQTSQPAHGTVTWNPANDGTFTYTPDKDWSGTDSFTYRICLPSPNQDVCTTATEYITVQPPITAVDDYYSTPLDTPMTKGSAGTGDSSPLGIEGATWTKTSNPAHGRVSGWDPATGKFTYTPDKGWSGTDSFTYRICLAAPNDKVCETATEYITVSSTTVKAVDDKYTTLINTPMTLGDAKAKDSSPAGLVGAAWTQTSQPLHGTVTGWDPATGTFTYTPDTNWTGSDSFTYRICLAAPNDEVCDTATEYITVSPVAVTAVNDYYTTPLNTPMTLGDAKAKDSSPAGLVGATWTQTSQPLHGTVTGWDPATGRFTYTPDQDWTGSDSFTYRICLAAPNDEVCDTATEYVTVGSASVTAIDDYYSTPLDTPMTKGAAATGDSSPLGLAGATWSRTSDPANGQVSGWDSVTGTFTYTPNQDWTGTDSFTYLVCLAAPNDKVCATATEFITVSPTSVTAVDDYYSTPLNTPMTKGDAKARDSSPAGLAGATLTQMSQPLHGTVTGWDPATGRFTYTPDKDWTGTDSFTYRICLAAPNGDVCDTATEFITVSPAIVKAVDDYYSTVVNTPMSKGNAKAKDSSPNGLAGATLTQLTQPKHGVVSGWDPATGRFTYTPDKDWTGTDSFTYRICLAAPNDKVCATATEYITVGTVPTVKATDDKYSTPMNTPMSKGNAKAKDSSPNGLAGATLTQLTQPKHGVVSGWDPATGRFTYTPGKDWMGTDSFRYRICLAAPNDKVCDTATEYITVMPPKPGAKPVTPPMAEDFGLDPGSTTHTFDPVSSFIPSKGAQTRPGTLSLAKPDGSTWKDSVKVPGQGTFTVVNGKVRFIADPSFVGTASIRYRIQDSSGQWAENSLTVEVAWSKPIAAPLTKDLGIWQMGQAFTFKAIKAFTPSRGADAVSTSLAIAPLGSKAWGKRVEVPGKGVFTLAGNGQVTYTGPACYTGKVIIRYRAQDTTGQWADSTLTIKVRNPGGKEICRL